MNNRDDFKKKKDDISCSRCGAMNLHWENTGVGWRLFTPEGTMHACYNSDKDKTKNYEKDSWKWKSKKG